MVWAIMAFPLAFGLAYVYVTRVKAMSGLPALLVALTSAAICSFALYRLTLGSTNAAGGVMRMATLPSGASTPYQEQFSYQESLAAKGDVAAALASYEAVIAERPNDLAPRLRAAELYAGRGKEPTRAAALYREIRDSTAATTRDALYASSRLVDLYAGPLDEPGRALVELRRIIERFPSSAAAKGAREALPRLKARLAAEQGRA
jgi:hypothetical protein